MTHILWRRARTDLQLTEVCTWGRPLFFFELASEPKKMDRYAIDHTFDESARESHRRRPGELLGFD